MRPFVILGFIVILVAAIWTGGWFYVANQVSGQLNSPLAFDGPDGDASLDCGSSSVAGFPFRFDVRCNDARLAYQDYTVTTPQLSVTALVYRPNHFIGFAESPVRIADAFSGSETEMEFGNLEASLRFEGFDFADPRLERFSVVTDTLKLTNLLFGNEIFEARHGELHLVKTVDETDGLMAFVTAEGIESPEAGLAGGSVSVEALLSQWDNRVAGWAEDQRLRAWQQAGGELAIETLDFSAEGMSLDLTGTVALNENGFAEVEAEAESLGLMDKLDLSMLGDFAPLIIGVPDENGIYRTPVTIRDGKLFAPYLPTPILALQTQPAF